MLTHTAIGPYEDGTYLVGYPTPGYGAVLTPVVECRSEAQAKAAIEALDREQIAREMRLRHDRELRGLDGHYPDLEGAQ